MFIKWDTINIIGQNDFFLTFGFFFNYGHFCTLWTFLDIFGHYGHFWILWIFFCTLMIFCILWILWTCLNIIDIFRHHGHDEYFWIFCFFVVVDNLDIFIPYEFFVHYEQKCLQGTQMSNVHVERDFSSS